MKISTIIAGLLSSSVALTAAEDVVFVTSLTALPGKLQQATDWFLHQTATFRAMEPAGQTALFAFPSGNNIVTVERYVDQKSALDWTFNKTHIDGCLGLFGKVDVLSAKMYTNTNLDIGSIFDQTLGIKSSN